MFSIYKMSDQMSFADRLKLRVEQDTALLFLYHEQCTHIEEKYFLLRQKIDNIRRDIIETRKSIRLHEALSGASSPDARN